MVASDMQGEGDANCPTDDRFLCWEREGAYGREVNRRAVALAGMSTTRVACLMTGYGCGAASMNRIRMLCRHFRSDPTQKTTWSEARLSGVVLKPMSDSASPSVRNQRRVQGSTSTVGIQCRAYATIYGVRRQIEWREATEQTHDRSDRRPPGWRTEH